LANAPRPAHFTEDKEAMTQREHEKLELAVWIGVISIELGLFTWLTNADVTSAKWAPQALKPREKLVFVSHH
jgi:hypothetical protein